MRPAPALRASARRRRSGRAARRRSRRRARSPATACAASTTGRGCRCTTGSPRAPRSRARASAAVRRTASRAGGARSASRRRGRLRAKRRSSSAAHASGIAGMPSHAARACATRRRCRRRSALRRRAQTAARSACSCSSARRWRSASARAASSAASRSRTTFDAFSKSASIARLDVGIGKQLDPRHARGGVRLAQLREIGRSTTSRASARPCRAPSADPLPCRPDRSRPARPPAALAFNSVRAFFCAALVRAFSAIAVSVSLDGFDRRSIAATAASACSPRSATPSISAASVRRSSATSRAPASARMTRDAAERLSRRARRQSPRGARRPDPPPSRPCASSRSRPSEASAATAVIATAGVVLRRLLDQLAERVVAHAAFGFVADDVGEHRRHRRCAPPRRAARARRYRPWRTRSATRCRPDRARESLRCGCWGRGAWTWTAGGACREFPLVVQTPAAHEPAGAFLPVCYFSSPSMRKRCAVQQRGIIALNQGAQGAYGAVGCR